MVKFDGSVDSLSKRSKPNAQEPDGLAKSAQNTVFKPQPGSKALASPTSRTREAANNLLICNCIARR